VAIRVLQCGAGIRGNHWAQFIREHPDTECVGVVDIDPAALANVKAAVQSDACAYFTGLDQALAQTDADAALIVSPSALHASQAIQCMEARLTVMIEKPFGTSVAEAQRVLERARALGKQVIVAENYRFFAAERTVRKLLRERFLGALDNATLIDRRHMPSQRVRGSPRSTTRTCRRSQSTTSTVCVPGSRRRRAASSHGSGTRLGPTTSMAPAPRR
jgi:predicted dehydrogenase